MRIAFVITNLAIGGAETMLLKLLQHLDRTRFRPTVISLIGSGEVGPLIAALGVPVHVVGMHRGGVPHPLALYRLAQMLRQAKPDVVHTWMYHADLLGGTTARWIGCPRVIWGLRHSNLSKSENKRSTLWVARTCAWLSGTVPAEILSCSVRAKSVHADLGYRRDKIHVIPNGFDLDRFQPDAAAAASVRTELGLPTNVLLVGLVARYDSQKNHAGFVQAAAHVAAQLPHVRFVLAGTGVDAANATLQSTIAAHGLQDRMHLLGRRDDVPRLMAALDVLASSSHGEAFPNVLGEAMACGVPCVVTDVGDSAEIVGSTGRVVPPGDMNGLARELVTVLQLPEAKRAALGEQARRRVAAHYEIGHVTRLYESFYEQVLARGRLRGV